MDYASSNVHSSLVSYPSIYHRPPVHLSLFPMPGGSDGEGGNDHYDDVDGKSMSEDEDVDGVPLDGAALLKRG